MASSGGGGSTNLVRYAAQETVEGMWGPAAAACNVTLRWDNSFSRWRSKALQYHIRVYRLDVATMQNEAADTGSELDTGAAQGSAPVQQQKRTQCMRSQMRSDEKDVIADWVRVQKQRRTWIWARSLIWRRWRGLC